LRFISLEGMFAVTRMPAEDRIPGWATGVSFTSITRTPEELSIVCPLDDVPSWVESEAPWSCLRVAGRLDFSMVGILSAVTVPLAAAGIPVLVISTYNTDHFLVKAMDFDRAVEVLRAAGHQVEVGTKCRRREGPDVRLADEIHPGGSSASA
jgi:uncharacterized protein